jgi:lysophospholipase L1-like esterase
VINRCRSAFLVAIPGALACCFLSARAQSTTTASPPLDLKYSFGTTPIPTYTPITPTDLYTPTHPYGYDLASTITPSPTATTSTQPFFFSTQLPPGPYRITLTLGNTSTDSTTTVKSETRRLMLESLPIPAHQSLTKSFLVHLRIPTIPGATGKAATVALKPREKNPILTLHRDGHPDTNFLELDWDEKLTLEFSGTNPSLSTLEITPAPDHTTVFLIGDSTVTDQPMAPWAAWGQILPRWFKEPLLIANYAESGETTASFIGERRWPKLLSELHPGDYVLMQFGINDRKIPLDRFKQYFVQFITDTRAKNATPILVTSQNLKKLDADGKAVQTLGGYPDAMRQVAADQKVPLIDLNQMSLDLYTAIGPDNLNHTFVDGTHQTDYGAYELAKCVITGLLANHIPFTQYLTDDWKPFDPTHPDPLSIITFPTDPQLDPARPNGPGAKNGIGPMAGAATTRPATRP